MFWTKQWYEKPRQSGTSNDPGWDWVEFHFLQSWWLCLPHGDSDLDGQWETEKPPTKVRKCLKVRQCHKSLNLTLRRTLHQSTHERWWNTECSESSSPTNHCCFSKTRADTHEHTCTTCDCTSFGIILWQQDHLPEANPFLCMWVFSPMLWPNSETNEQCECQSAWMASLQSDM